MFGWRPCLLCQFSQEDMAVTLQVAMVTHRLTLITPLRIGGASKESRRKPRPATTFCWRKGKKQTNKTTLLMRRSFSIRDGGNEVGLKMPRKCVFSTNNFDVGSDLDLSFVLFSPLHFSWTPSYFPSQWFFFSFLFLVLVMVSYFQHYLPPEYFFFFSSLFFMQTNYSKMYRTPPLCSLFCRPFRWDVRVWYPLHKDGITRTWRPWQKKNRLGGTRFWQVLLSYPPLIFPFPP